MGEIVSACESALQLNDVFENLTDKQHEVLALVGDNFTSKEIAYELGISVSAVNQRIETVRARAGSLSRLELARAYREFLQEQDDEQTQRREEAEEGSSTAPVTREQDPAPPGADADELTGEPDGACVDDAACHDCERWPGRDLAAGQLQIVRVQPPSAQAERAAVGLGGQRTVRGGAGALAGTLRGRKRTPGPVPALLDGHNARLGRMAAIVVIAFGLLLVSATGLGVLHSLAELF
ncbi:helix-turn-helix domain-containing protein [Novosphingobium mangrovi (ex Hu et al. 2023)]|uniref:Helix-turn-helix transcriptional regulator n=1 Tax=Novosphingobium mangrovi (ex Hu et al. 2023) TaxID=2930094 RepID=A0ABT0A7E6_9SPHN|nr:helix-turn-helix transcriptional regulator [Novosphingobium mangrovi (ex Hu et al. 2023)]MCJ1959109.1 helix-turn-helix transcriptional regulator [Novosphingobium mangrovi (ex Hu et al. 2023)]